MFSSLKELHDHCRQERHYSSDHWQRPQLLMPSVHEDGLQLTLETGEHVNLTDWSFSQLCRLSGMSKETVNRFHPETAKLAFRDTLPSSDKPIQLLTTGQSIHSFMACPTRVSGIPNCWKLFETWQRIFSRLKRRSMEEQDCTVENRTCSAS